MLGQTLWQGWARVSKFLEVFCLLRKPLHFCAYERCVLRELALGFIPVHPHSLECVLSLWAGATTSREAVAFSALGLPAKAAHVGLGVGVDTGETVNRNHCHGASHEGFTCSTEDLAVFCNLLPKGCI